MTREVVRCILCATERIEADIEKLDEKIKAFKLQMEDREAGKEVALGTR